MTEVSPRLIKRLLTQELNSEAVRMQVEKLTWSDAAAFPSHFLLGKNLRSKKDFCPTQIPP